MMSFYSLTTVVLRTDLRRERSANYRVRTQTTATTSLQAAETSSGSTGEHLRELCVSLRVYISLWGPNTGSLWGPIVPSPRAVFHTQTAVSVSEFKLRARHWFWMVGQSAREGLCQKDVVTKIWKCACACVCVFSGLSVSHSSPQLPALSCGSFLFFFLFIFY